MSAVSRTRWLLALPLAVVALGCGEPTAQLIQPADTRFTYELPTEFTDIGIETETETAPGLAYGIANSSVDKLANDPVMFVATAPTGDLESFKSLRVRATGGEFDPLDTTLDELPNDTTLLDYVEIGETEVWGIRMRLAIGRGAADFQALVDRESDQVVFTELICTQACFIEQLELIDQIQNSWNLEQ